ncbi:hypothetical protein IAI10_04505 [Clostridium sp. 19966]|uniref:hypothetical protein n=1 Tax=Clostridium sp. 19966 TaxID=2768166 RepID=UPI0028E06DED|nr:hypothetical protein [Clostridium sp. 19966]MDT8715907.1 hypothetical protein [Clostridium sp. 19966]
MKNKNIKFIFIFMFISLLVCTILLSHTIQKSIIPTERSTVAHIPPNAKPHSHQLIPMHYSFNNKTYTKYSSSVSAKDIDLQIGLTSNKDLWPNLPAYKIKGLDSNKSIAVKISDNVYYQVYNYKYWVTQLPQIIIYSLLILFISIGIFMFSKRNFRK